MAGNRAIAGMLVAMLVSVPLLGTSATTTPTCRLRCDGNGSNRSSVQTQCLQAGLDACHAAHPASVVALLPKGVYHTGALVVPSNTTLRLASGATLLGSTDPTGT